jgi:hypothetical protein
MLKYVVFAFAATVSLTISASQGNIDIPKAEGPSQKRICHVEEAAKAGTKCNDGDIMLFLPIMESGRSAIVLSSLVCDFRYNIMHRPDALSCVFTTRRSDQWEKFDMEAPK